MDPVEFGKKLRQIRRDKDITQQYLGEKTGFTKSYLSIIENGKQGIPQPSTLRKLAQGLEMPYMELMKLAGYVQEADSFFDLVKHAKNPIDSMSAEEQQAHFDGQNEHYKKVQYEHDHYPDIKRILENKTPLIKDVYYDEKKLDKEQRELFIKVLNGLTSDLEKNYPSDEMIEKEVREWNNTIKKAEKEVESGEWYKNKTNK